MNCIRPPPPGGRALRTWLQITHCSIFDRVTIPEVVNLVPQPAFTGRAVVEALGRPRNLTVSRQALALAHPFGPHLTTEWLFSNGSISLSPLYPNLTIDLHVRTAASLHQSFLWLHPTQA